jgi:hypothetical protein
MLDSKKNIINDLLEIGVIEKQVKSQRKNWKIWRQDMLRCVIGQVRQTIVVKGK